MTPSTRSKRRTRGEHALDVDELKRRLMRAWIDELTGGVGGAKRRELAELSCRTIQRGHHIDSLPVEAPLAPIKHSLQVHRR